MNSYELTNKIEPYSKLFSVDSYLLSFLAKTLINYDEIQKIIVRSLHFNASDTPILLAKSRNEISSLSSTFKDFAPRRIFKDIEDIVSFCMNFFIVQNDSSLNDNIIIRTVERFSFSYENYLKDSDIFNTIQLLRDSENLHFVLRSSFQIFEKIETSLYDYSEKTNIENIISLYFPSYQEFNEFSLKIVAIKEIYNELSTLLNVSIIEHPIKIIKIESGSFLSKIFGESQVIKLFTDLVRSFVSYMHRTFTTEGKIASIPRKIETIESIIDLAKRLEGIGIDTTLIKDNIEKSSIHISKNLYKLVAKEPTVEINSEKYSLSTEIEKKYLEEGKKKLLLEKFEETN